MSVVSESVVAFNKADNTMTATLNYKRITFTATIDVSRELRLIDSYDYDPYEPEPCDIEFIQDNIVFYRMTFNQFKFFVYGPVECDYIPEPDFEG